VKITMGLDPGLFLSPPDSNLVCTICHEVLEAPRCCQQGHSYCMKCIEMWLTDNDSCPIGRRHLTTKMLTTQRALQGIIGSLRLRCPNSALCIPTADLEESSPVSNVSTASNEDEDGKCHSPKRRRTFLEVSSGSSAAAPPFDAGAEEVKSDGSWEQPRSDEQKRKKEASPLTPANLERPRAAPAARPANEKKHGSNARATVAGVPPRRKKRKSSATSSGEKRKQPSQELKKHDGMDPVLARGIKGKICTWVGTVSELQAHVEVCPFEIVTCSSIGCQSRKMRYLMTSHVNTCPHRKQPCANCREQVAVGNMLHHIQRECPESLMQCKGCNASVKRKEQDEHERLHCPQTVIYCEHFENGCQASFKRKDEQAHYAEAAVTHAKLVTAKLRKLEDEVYDLKRAALEAKVTQDRCDPT